MFYLDLLSSAIEHAAWYCPNPECERKGNTGNYCGGCTYPAPWRKEAFQTVGNIVRFGHYEQDDNLENGQEEIEWIVLDVQDGKSLLISKNGLDVKPYNTSYTSVTWETCTLRSWLNNDFLEVAFSVEKQSTILEAKVDDKKSQGFSEYSTNGGNNSHDQIFLLSYYEVFDLFFMNNDARKGITTDYAETLVRYKSNSIKVDGRATRLCWLRSPGSVLRQALIVDLDGTKSYQPVDGDSVCVRPAFWINLETDIF